MNNPFNDLPSYVKEAPKFAKFLNLLNSYLISGALENALFKENFLSDKKLSYVIKSLANQLNIEVDIPFVGGNPDWEAYYKRLYYAYRARAFNSSFDGTLAGLLTRDTLGDVSNMVVLDFSVAKDIDRGDGTKTKIKSPMSVLYSIIAIDNNLTEGIVQDYLIPKITGVGSSLYYVTLGQEVFGYDLDELKGEKIGPDHVNTVPIEGKFNISSATINSTGTGYQVGDVVTTLGVVVDGKEVAKGIKLYISDLSVGAFLVVADPNQKFEINPSAHGVPVSGGSGTGMKVNITGIIGRGYFICGFDQGSFLPIVGR